MGTVVITNQIPWKLVGEEAEKEKKEVIEELITDLGFSKERAERRANSWLKAVNQTAREFGEEVEPF